MAVEIKRRRFTVGEYHKMAEAGILTEDDRVELIEGEIVDMAPIGVEHARCVDRLAMLLFAIVSSNAIVRVQNPIKLGDLAEPQPDLTLIRARDYSMDTSHPGPEDILLVVEVSDTTLQFDRTEKLPLYARSGIPEAWIVNLKQDLIEVYSEPEEGVYKKVNRAGRGQALPVPGFPDAAIKVDDVVS